MPFAADSANDNSPPVPIPLNPPKECKDNKDDPCDKLEKNCKGIAKNVERHVRDIHLHPGPCKTLQIGIQRALKAGCGNRAGVQYSVGVYNRYCAGDWSSQYPDHTPKFPQF